MSETVLHLLSAGAAQGLVGRLLPRFEAANAARVQARFGAVGAMQELLLQGEPCDVMVLTDALLRQLAEAGHMVGASLAPLGRVYTGVGVRQGRPLPDVGSDLALRALLLECDALYVPDTQRSTAGQHVLRVLRSLDLLDAMQAKLREHPNGATAMRTMAAEGSQRSIGITQVSEILATPGITMVARLPKAYELATLYSAAVGTAAAQPELARRFIDVLTASQAVAERAACGIEG